MCIGLPLAAASPAYAARSLTVTPHTDLRQDQIVSVTGAGFAPRVNVRFCEAVVDATPNFGEDCGAAAGVVLSSSTGEISGEDTVVQTIHPPSVGRPVNCWVDTCVILAVEDNHPSSTAAYSAPLTFVRVQPDAQLRRLSDSVVLGDNVYSVVGSGETFSQGISPGRVWSFAVQVQNDGGRTENIAVRASSEASSSAIQVRYFAGWVDVTSLVTRSGFTFVNVPPGGIRRLPVQFRAASNATFGARARRLVEFDVDERPGLILAADAVGVGVRVVARP